MSDRRLPIFGLLPVLAYALAGMPEGVEGPPVPSPRRDPDPGRWRALARPAPEPREPTQDEIAAEAKRARRRARNLRNKENDHG